MFKLNNKQKIQLGIIVCLNLINLLLGLVNNTGGYSIQMIYVIGFSGTLSIILTGILAQSIIDSHVVKVKNK